MRSFDSKFSWLDNDGKPLVGRIHFYKLHTTENENIYDYQGIALSNPIYTNTIGQITNQVFLADNTDYTVVFEKYIGNGNMEDDEELTNWAFQYSCDNLWKIYSISVVADSIQNVDTIADLQELDPDTVDTRDNHKVVILSGYNTIGDKPQVMYIWNELSTAISDEGSIIKVNDISVGRWELVNSFSYEGVDVRHFGVFGASSRIDATDQMSNKIYLANAYAVSVGLPLYFPAIDGLTWYKMNNLVITSAHFAKNTKVFGNTDTATTISVVNDTEYLDVFNNSDYNAVFTITGPIVRTSWGVNSTNCVYNPTYKLIVDSVINTSNKSFSNIIVDCQYEIVEGCSFEYCQINAIKKLGDNTIFRNCKLDELMFSDATDFTTVTVYDNDVINLSNWPTTSKWLTLVAQNSNTVLDFEGRTLDSSCTLDWSGYATYKNAVFDGFTVKQTNVLFDNCNGTIYTTIAMNYTFNDSILVITPTTTAINSIAAKNSTISFGATLTMTSFTATNCTFNDSDYGYIATTTCNIKDTTMIVAISAPSVVADNCLLHNVVSQTPIITNSQIYGRIIQVNLTDTIDFTIQGNTFYEGGRHELSSAIVDSVVNGKWTNNHSFTSYQFVQLDRTNLNPDEQVHGYVYEGNTGTNTLQRLKATWVDDLTIAHNVVDAQGITDSKLATYSTFNGSTYVVSTGRMNRNDENGGGSTMLSIYLTQCQFFSVGTSNIGNLTFMGEIGTVYDASGTNQLYYLDWKPSMCSINDKEALWYSTSIGFAKGIMFYKDYTWRIAAARSGFILVGPSIVAQGVTIRAKCRYRLEGTPYLQSFATVSA